MSEPSLPSTSVGERPRDVGRSAPAAVAIEGYALVLFAFDLGFQIDLDGAEPLVGEATRRRVLRSRRPAPGWFDYSPPPLQLSSVGASVRVGSQQTEAAVDVLVYDFGAALLTFRLPLPAQLADLPELSAELYEHRALEAEARQRAGHVLDAIRPAVERPELSDACEDYLVMAVTTWPEDLSPAAILRDQREVIARAVDGERGPLSPEQVLRSTEGVMSFAPTDLAVFDWNAAVLFDRAPDDMIALVQHANVELLEMRVLDAELDKLLDHADELLSSAGAKLGWPGLGAGRMLRRFAGVQTDAAVMFGGVNNAIKLLGNQYLARVYRLAASRLDVPAWQASVQRKLDATDSVYQKLSDAASTRRLEILEWVIIILIAVSIVLPLMPWYR